jgi:hypothetical protein
MLHDSCNTNASKIQLEAIDDLVKEYKARYGLNTANPIQSDLT